MEPALLRRVPRVAIFVSKLPHCLYDLLARWRLGELRAEIPLIISNHEDARPDRGELRRAVPLPAGERGDEAIAGSADRASCSRASDIELIVLARYMQVLSAGFVEGTGSGSSTSTTRSCPRSRARGPYHQAHERGVKVIGATAHYATPELDQGPIIEQDVAA